jgi:hypothetical protein
MLKMAVALMDHDADLYMSLYDMIHTNMLRLLSGLLTVCVLM